MDRERRLSARNGTRTPPDYTNGKFRDDNNGFYGGGFLDRSEKSPSRSNILRIPSPTSSPPPPSGSSPERGYIEHRVSKFDTLAGIAIKYGVEVTVLTIVALLKCILIRDKVEFELMTSGKKFFNFICF